MIPDVLLDNTDGTTTFNTGNKFEIRAVGSSTNCAPPMIVMNNRWRNYKVQKRCRRIDC